LILYNIIQRNHFNQLNQRFIQLGNIL
jgi:hypothetical protein